MSFLYPLKSINISSYPDIMLVEQRFRLSKFSSDLFYRLGVKPNRTIKQALIKRQAEYLASRSALQKALENFGYVKYQLVCDKDRVPIWPNGIRGSLSHSHERAVVTLCNSYLGYWLGIDCEMILSLDRAHKISDAIIQPKELKIMKKVSLPFTTIVTMIFSMKESLYKAIFPKYRQLINFRKISLISISDDASQAILKISKHTSNINYHYYNIITWYNSNEITTLAIVNDY